MRNQTWQTSFRFFGCKSNVMPSDTIRRGYPSNKMCQLCIDTIKWIPVLLIVSIIGWSYYAYVVQLCFLTVDSVIEEVLYLIGYHVIFILFLWSYWQTIFTQSAKVPSKFRLPYSELEKMETVDEASQRQIIERFAQTLPVNNRTIQGLVRWCEKCQIVKPDRAHHCSVCGYCVLKMDHHCPWVNNCVCFSNYKFFNLFLAYALLYCIFITLTTLQYFVRFWRGEFHGMGKFNIIFLFFVALMFAVSLVSLFGYHVYLILHNRSTLEAFRAPVFASGPDKNGFSLGAYSNFQEVFGDNRSSWFLPVFTSRGDGIEFPVRPQHQPHYQSMANSEPSLGDGVTFPQLAVDEDMSSLLQTWPEDAEFHAPPFSSQAGSLLDPSPV